MYASPWGGDSEDRDLVKQQLIYQRLFDLGCEIANHTLDHNKGGLFWTARPPAEQVRELEGCTEWLREHVVGFTRPFSHKGGGGASGSAVDPQFTRALMEKQRFIYRGGRGGHPNDQMWPMDSARQPGTWTLPTGSLDAAAPPVHATITDPINSDYSGRFDFEVPEGVAMWQANFDYHYRHPRRPILGVNAFHDWGFKTLDDSRIYWSHRNEGPILKAFLMDVLVTNKEKYPDTHCVTFRQVIEYAVSDGDLEHTLKAGNCQDSRNPEKPLIP
jgi:hypothetical protein